ncbi:hypothetical protein Sulku_2633 (plasmid) [Sulfuricurvum kujiense DSM 16994]|uniref:Uncharacterized protein n=1 Tax=Sulfuricurvum kujiense (strain ATCC BAA-921 / DSM 16994 / JCM 11577 / YK-1) TaxID=709032 RepID=E4U3M0_SULKY|nr:hypothetical protein Sulku_2633 [Sulfuricurvum kujiense DSM 16994]
MYRSIIMMAMIGYLINTNGLSIDSVKSFIETMTTSPEYMVRHIVNLLIYSF